MRLEITRRSQDFYDAPNPSGLGAANVIGNVPFDPGNAKRQDTICDDIMATGVFPRAVQIYSFAQTYQDVFGFDELAGTNGKSVPRLRELNFAYLQGRLVLDGAVTEIMRPRRSRA